MTDAEMALSILRKMAADPDDWTIERWSTGGYGACLEASHFDITEEEAIFLKGAEMSRVRRMTVYEPQPGDRVVLEVAAGLDEEQMEYLRDSAQIVFGPNLDIVVLDGPVRLRGVEKGLQDDDPAIELDPWLPSGLLNDSRTIGSIGLDKNGTMLDLWIRVDGRPRWFGVPRKAVADFLADLSADEIVLSAESAGNAERPDSVD